ncbi:2-nonaprenyl-3-methyl-6-methoxy-1,4-benzoquinol hydroxylase [Anaplasma phagocytophilum]|nr:2-nonaprenyl-3-methyl-6-methoxy-1,4-benzoquinol hydroxylase [Anaplasma phagocytophilum]SBO33330.1 2-nonaprenyl-3-methyl-6-methoxy-1,4-benzoquinol hydroxylase [Anaplasma phagocytophilum]SBO33403.1 2-nonaprenyl-3-methyl-6-methoxy-1,4-benzoquinol hydroxylase [Anaplasma phagocytophilum]SCV65107.1 2-nonaprenyl-3-methyl-6-methoxy-1,4-benzoquinol hydroxylase [Anaplasma phagocytophilum]
MRKECVESMIRVNHAGEYAAVCIYHGQEMALRGKAEAESIREMQQHELVHFRYFDNAIKERRVRPTVFLPIWHVAAVSLGYITAIMGKEAAMACTEAVEEVICGHYDEQAGQLERSDSEHELRNAIVRFREEEREHMEIAAHNGAERALGYKAISCAVKTACRLAIAISKVL